MTVEPSFGERNFGGAELGDRRRTARLVELADRLALHPGGSLPEKLSSAAQLRAAYRLMARPEVTHEAVFSGHREATLARAAEHDGRLLAICDTTELDYTSHERLEQLGPIGDGGGRGYLAHHVLIVDPATQSVVGLAEQILQTRRRVPTGETRAASRSAEDRESRLWTRGTAHLAANPRLTVVADRGADLFEFLEDQAHSGRRFVVRAKADRNALVAGRKTKLFAWARGLRSCGERSVVIGRGRRRARLLVSHGRVTLVPPRQPRGEHSQRPLPTVVVRVWEPRPPRGVKPVEWILLTNVPAEDAAAAEQVVDDYTCRWIVEEFHKGLKSGCDVEQLRLGDEERLKPMIALVSVAALTLLELRDAARDERRRDESAERLVPRAWLEVLSLAQGREPHEPWTIGRFTRELGRLGGHAAHPGTPKPGWLVLWRGWQRLQLLAAGAELVRKNCG
jgi:hypothetical protein